MKNRNIIIVGQQAWDTEIGSNCKNIALEFSKQNRVLYINPPLDRISKMRGRNDPKVLKRLDIISGKNSGLEEITPNLFTLYPDCLIESINWLPGSFLFNAVNKINNKRFFNAIKATISDLGFTDAVLFNDSDIFRSFYLIELLQPIASIYYSRDNMLATEYYKKHGTVFEPLLIAKNDLCVANSSYLSDYCGKYNSNSHYVGQGCDFALFDAYLAKKSPRRKNQRPVIGYVGVLTSARLDIALIADIARQMPGWIIELVGPEDDDFRKSELHGLDNVKFLGPQDTEDLPKYIDGFDVCFNPQVVNELTIGNYPRKIDEYLVLGKPTIATDTPTMQLFKPYVLLASNASAYVQGIKELIDTDNETMQQQRKAYARTHSWATSVNEIYNALENTVKK
ncbi:glycosyltransferase [Pedobacter sandarakinus]|uniref:glycosyltransferase n=1 Tax=Pedobacter sandarakinus TaxID=353156 RepID=UPI0022454CDC|nr:glycosyltransferase [Pedobacter sandarakinus]MCX2574876.1 glycosyltransferase [Pedobacter sandarakinus]